MPAVSNKKAGNLPAFSFLSLNILVLLVPDALPALTFFPVPCRFRAPWHSLRVPSRCLKSAGVVSHPLSQSSTPYPIAIPLP
jgi:hypothetical protein